MTRTEEPGMPYPPPAGALAVVIPALNERHTIGELVCGAVRQAAHVIVVDDGSTDGTAEILAGLPAQLVRHPTNLGKGDSLLTGFRTALSLGAAAVITMDGDGQHRPDDIPLFVEAARRSPGSLVLGNRLTDPSKIPRSRYQANTIANFWISWACGYHLEDSQCGFRLYPREALEALKIDERRGRGFIFESEILIDAARQGFRGVSVPIPPLYDEVTRRPSHFRPTADITRIVLMVAWKLISRGMAPLDLYRSLRERLSG